MIRGEPVPSLEQRVRRLERTNRLLLTGCLVATCLLVVGGASHDKAAETVRTQQLQIVDATGAVRAQFNGTPEGAGLEILDAQGVHRISLQHGTEDTALFLRDAEGTTRIGVSQFAHGGGGFALHGEKARGAAVLYLKGDAGSLTFYDGDGSVQHRFPQKP